MYVKIITGGLFVREKQGGTGPALGGGIRVTERNPERVY